MPDRLSDLERELETVFGSLPRPDTLIKMNVETRARYTLEINALENMDWDNGVPSDLDEFYEPNTFLSTDGYRYLIPKVFRFCLKWGKEASDKDIINTMLYLPFLANDGSIWKNFCRDEKFLLWCFLEECNKLIGCCIFDDFDDAQVLKNSLVEMSK